MSSAAFSVVAAGQSAGVEIDEDELVRRLDGLALGDVVSVDAVNAMAHAAGLRTAPWQGTVSDLWHRRAPLPILVVTDSNVVAIVKASGGVSVVVDGQQVDGDEAALRERLGSGVINGLVVVPAAPLASLVHHAAPLSRVWALARLERRDTAVIVVYAVVVGLLSLVTPLAVQALVSALAMGTVLQPVVVLSVVVVVALVVVGALRTLQLYVVEMVQRRVFVRLVGDLAWRLPRLRPEPTRDDSKLINRFFDVITVQKTAASLLLDGLTLVLEIIVGLIVLAFYSNYLLAFAALLVVALVFVVVVVGRGAISTSIDESYAKHDVAGWFEDVVHQTTAFKARAARDLAVTRAEALARGYLDARAAHFRVLLRQAISFYGLQAASAAALLGVGGALVLDGTLTLGQLVAAELIVFGVLAGIAKLPKQLESAYDLVASVDKIGYLIDLEVDDHAGAAVNAGPLGFAIEDVVAGSAHFDSFAVKAGEHIAVLGPSGCGKSALVDVLIGARAPDSGRVSVDGDDVRHIAVEALRDRVGVARNVEIFAGALSENLRIGRRDLRPRDLVEVLRVVELDDVVLGRPEGLALHLQPNNGVLSTSELRRLMMARALLGTPGIVVLDTILDDVDVEAGVRILTRIQQHLKGTTLVVTTCRPELAARLPRTIQLSASKPSSERSTS